jgi:hypothetical protein
MSRFLGFSGPWVGFTVEVDIPDPVTGATVTHKRLITAGNATTCTISWNEPLPSSAAGRVYRIKEVYILNRWAERTLRIIKADGTTVDTPIVGNCEDTLFFTPVTGLTIDNTMTYAIIEFLPGTTVQRDGGNTKWQRPSGTDTVRKGVTTPANFTDPSENLAYIQKRYGRYMDRDIVCPLIYNEIYQVLNALRWVRFPNGWTNNNETNFGFARDSTGGAGGPGDACALVRSEWGIDMEQRDNSAPFAFGSCNFDGEYATAEINREYAYGTFTFPCAPLRFAIGVDWWNKAIFTCSPGVTSCTFDAMGDDVANGTFVKWSSQGPSNQQSWVSGILGSLGAPNCPACFPTGSNRDLYQGWSIAESYAIAKGNVVGGFTQTTTTDGS